MSKPLEKNTHLSLNEPKHLMHKQQHTCLIKKQNRVCTLHQDTWCQICLKCSKGNVNSTSYKYSMKHQNWNQKTFPPYVPLATASGDCKSVTAIHMAHIVLEISVIRRLQRGNVLWKQIIWFFSQWSSFQPKCTAFLHTFTR